MARRGAQPPADVPLYLAMPREEASRKIDERIDRGGKLRTRTIRDRETFTDVQRNYRTWDEYNEEMLRQMFTSPKIAEEYSHFFGGSIPLRRGEPTLGEQIDALH